MSGFEFFFGFFGLILGLSVVEVFTGLGRILRRRERLRLGVVTPLLATLVLLDVASFWSVSWVRMQSVEPTYLLLLSGLAIAGIYYLSATLVFPDDLDAWPSLDEFYDRHKRWVIGGIWSAKTLSHTVLLVQVGGLEALKTFWWSIGSLLVVLWFYPLMVGICLVRNRTANAVMLFLLCLFFVVVAGFVR